MAITVNEIAKQCGVSRTTVLRALNNAGSVKPETRERILAVAKEHNYTPNLLARSLNHGQTMSLGIVTINVDNMYFVQSLNVINKEADKRGYFANIAVCEEDAEWEKKLIRGFAQRKMDGIIISPIGKGKEFEEFLGEMGIPVVCLGNKVSDKITSVLINEKEATMKAVDLIVSKGYERIVFVCPPLADKKKLNIYTHLQREDGFNESAKKYEHLEFAQIGTKEYLAHVETILRDAGRKKTAFLCSGDIYALNILEWGKAKGLSVPDDFGLMGFDNISTLKYVTPRLSTVSTNLEGVAATALQELLMNIESDSYSPKTIMLNYEILDRESL